MLRTITTTYRAAFTGLPRDVWLLSLVMLVNRSGSMVLPFISLYLTHERELSVTRAGQLLSLYGLGSVVASYAGGWLTDRLGSRRAMLLSLFSSGVAFAGLALLREVWAIAVGVLALSVVAESFRPACMTAMGERAPSSVNVRAYALLRLAANLGVGIGPAVGGVLALYDYAWLFYADALTCWLAAGVLLLALPEIVPQARADEPEPSRRRGSPWTDGPFLLLMLLVTVLAVAFFQILSTLPLYFREVYRFREDTIGLLLAVNPLVIVLFEMVLIHWAERRERMRLIGVGAFLVCAGFGLMPFGSGVVWAAGTILVWTLGEMLALPLLNAVVADRAAAASRGRYMGVYTMAYAVALLLAPAVGTAVYGTAGPDVLWYAVGALAPALYLGAWGLRRWFGGHPDTEDPRGGRESGAGMV